VRRLAFLLVIAIGALFLPLVAVASEERPTLEELERETRCPTCNTTLALSHSAIADEMRAFVRRRIAAGDSKSEIKAKLVAEFGEEVLAAPPKRGFNLIAWVLPLALAGGAILVLGLVALRWVRERDSDTPTEPSRNGRPPLDPELERRLDEELARFEA
jgi:cytochrome c-type biogenesis protein CcmH